MRIADLEEYLTTYYPELKFKPGDMVYIRPLHGGHPSTKAHRIDFISWANNEWIAWLNGIRGSVSVARLRPAKETK
mgnify:CR=1 FL=1